MKHRYKFTSVSNLHGVVDVFEEESELECHEFVKLQRKMFQVDNPFTVYILHEGDALYLYWKIDETKDYFGDSITIKIEQVNDNADAKTQISK